jgi:2,4-diketo-3-deoxy-L-fuconate hydrolase
MKLLRYGEAGAERPGILDDQGRIRDLSPHAEDIDLAAGGELISRLSRINVESLSIVGGNPRLGPPIARVGKFLAIGLNYVDHAAESKMDIPAEPMIFTKANSCIVGANDDIVLPPGSVKTDWELELGIVIGARASYISEEDAPAHIAGYLVVNDVSEREYQMERGGTWDKGKGCDTYGPIGPWLVTSDEVGDPQALAMWLEVNGVRMQTGHTKNMIFSCAKIVSYVSHFMTLMPGDIITTGTPAGVGFGRKPPVFLKDGDIVTLGIEGLGQQRQLVRSSTAAQAKERKAS